MNMIRCNYCISSILFYILISLGANVWAQESTDKKSASIIQDLLSESGDYLPIERVLISGQFIVDRNQLKPLVPIEVERLYAEVIEQVFKIIVLDESNSNSRKVVSMGSAVAINPNTLITNCHILGSQRIFARYQAVGVPGRLIALRLVSGDRKTDRCMVQANENVFKPVKGVRLSETIIPGEKVYSVGYPLIFDLSIAEGLIASVRKKGPRSLFLSTAVTSKGSSGGALFDRFGYLVGITTAVVTQADHYSLAIPASDYFGP